MSNVQRPNRIQRFAYSAHLPKYKQVAISHGNEKFYDNVSESASQITPQSSVDNWHTQFDGFIPMQANSTRARFVTSL